jgi:hypothetical protein
MHQNVAIHQPNYLPWLGYFHKIALADVFVFLDDVQFSKGSYTNRVRILSPNGTKWLTVPINVHLGDTINQVLPSREAWVRGHLDTLRGVYRGAPAFQNVWPDIRDLMESVPMATMAEVNETLVRGLTELLGLSCLFLRSSRLNLSSVSDERLVEIVTLVAPGGTYLSGRGAVKYQDPEKFSAAGLGFEYADFQHPEYPQGKHLGVEEFVQGLTVLDAAFHLGWQGAADMVQG